MGTQLYEGSVEILTISSKPFHASHNLDASEQSKEEYSLFLTLHRFCSNVKVKVKQGNQTWRQSQII